MGLEQEIEEVEIIENLDEEGTYQLGKHRDEYFMLNICPANEQEPDDDKVEYRIFPDHEEYSETLGDCVPCELVIYMHDDVPEAFRKPIIAHEVGESILDRQDRPKVEAHNCGIECERAYANKFLDEKTKKAFLEWTEENAVR